MADDRWLGAELAGYRIEALIGHGGIGVVYLATHLQLQRQVALKLLVPALAADAEYRHRFEREARLAASLDHPHIVPIYDGGYAQGVLYLAMRYIEGPNLATVIDNDAPMDLGRVCELLGGVADALDTAHDAGLVHRDIKPANVLVAAAGRPRQERSYLCDFGIARHTAARSALTSTGQFLGTVQYCAPEQIQGQPVDGRADQYALGCVAFHCLTGQVPFPADEPSAVMFAHLHADPPRAGALRPGLPAVDDIITRALAKQPTQRFPDCATFIQALRAAANTTTAESPWPDALSSPSTLIWRRRRKQTQRKNQNTTATQTSEGTLVTALRRRLGKAFGPVLVLVALLPAVIVGLVSLVGWITNPVIATIPVPFIAEGVAITPDGRHAYIADNPVAVIETAKQD